MYGELDSDAVYRAELLSILNDLKNELRRITLTLQYVSGYITPNEYGELMETLDIKIKVRKNEDCNR